LSYSSSSDEDDQVERQRLSAAAVDPQVIKKQGLTWFIFLYCTVINYIIIIKSYFYNSIIVETERAEELTDDW